jgi:hypothetical protein
MHSDILRVHHCAVLQAMARLADLVHVMGTLLQALKAFVDGGVDDLLFRQVQLHCTSILLHSVNGPRAVCQWMSVTQAATVLCYTL